MQKLFAITSQGAAQPVEILSGVSKEAQLRDIAAGNLKTLFGIRFFAKEYKIKDRQTDPVKTRRIDTVGISEDNCPVLFEYKKGKDSKVVNQILSYYYMFQDEEADFRLRVSQDPELGMDIAKKLDFNGIRLICLAREFTRDDLNAWRANDFIELVTYRYFDNNTLLLEWIKGVPPQPPVGEKKPLPKPIRPSPAPRPAPNIKSVHRTLQHLIDQCDSPTRDLYNKISRKIANLGKDISQYETSRLNNFKRGQRFACLRPVPTESKVLVWLNLDPEKEEITEGFTRDVSKTATDAGNLNLEVSIGNKSQLTKASALCGKAYREQKPPSSKTGHKPTRPRVKKPSSSKSTNVNRALQHAIDQCNSSTKALYDELSQGIANLGRDVTQYETSRLNKFKISQLFAVVRPFPKKDKVTILVKLDPKQEEIIEGFTRDTTNIATEANVCPLEITVRNQQQVKKALDLCRKAYNQSKR